MQGACGTGDTNAQCVVSLCCRAGNGKQQASDNHSLFHDIAVLKFIFCSMDFLFSVCPFHPFYYTNTHKRSLFGLGGADLTLFNRHRGADGAATDYEEKKRSVPPLRPPVVLFVAVVNVIADVCHECIHLCIVGGDHCVVPCRCVGHHVEHACLGIVSIGALHVYVGCGEILGPFA